MKLRNLPMTVSYKPTPSVSPYLFKGGVEIFEKSEGVLKIFL